MDLTVFSRTRVSARHFLLGPLLGPVRSIQTLLSRVQRLTSVRSIILLIHC